MKDTLPVPSLIGSIVSSVGVWIAGDAGPESSVESLRAISTWRPLIVMPVTLQSWLRVRFRLYSPL